MDGDMNNIFQKFNSIMEDKDMADNLKNILNNFSSSSESNNSNNSNNQTHENSNNSSEKKDNSSTSQKIPEFDINTILKIKNIMDSLNKDSDDPRSNLLLSLKPYLGESKKEKVDQYVKFLHFAKVLEVLNPMGGDNNKNE